MKDQDQALKVAVVHLGVSVSTDVIYGVNLRSGIYTCFYFFFVLILMEEKVRILRLEGRKEQICFGKNEDVILVTTIP